jgi:hypothetical protein
MVSYFDYSSDKSRFPKVDEVIHTATMSKEQAREISAKGGPEPGSAALAVLVEESTNLMVESSTRVLNSFQLPSDISLNDFSPKLAMLIETIQKYPDDKHFVYSAFHEDGIWWTRSPRNFESIDYVGWIRRLWCWRTVVRKTIRRYHFG